MAEIPGLAEIKVLIVDDDPLVLSSLRTYFKKAPHITVVGEAQDGHEALNLVSKGGVDVVLTDIHMPTMDGIELLERIQKVAQPPKFVAITSFDTDETMIKILSLGGNGYILKTARPESIISTIEDVVQGGTVISPVSATRLIKTLPSRSISSYKVTNAEKEVLNLICKGMSNHDIASELGKSSGTVKKHLSSLFSKFGASSRLDLALKAIDAGFKTTD
nr:response regulator transcription factor [Corynebacterium lactis]